MITNYTMAFLAYLSVFRQTMEFGGNFRSGFVFRALYFGALYEANVTIIPSNEYGEDPYLEDIDKLSKFKSGASKVVMHLWFHTQGIYQ